MSAALVHQKEKPEQSCSGFLLERKSCSETYSDFVAAFLRLRIAPAIPARPVPRSTMVVGSGTGRFGSQPLQKKKLSCPPEASETLAERPRRRFGLAAMAAASAAAASPFRPKAKSDLPVPLPLFVASRRVTESARCALKTALPF